MIQYLAPFPVILLMDPNDRKFHFIIIQFKGSNLNSFVFGYVATANGADVSIIHLGLNIH